MTTLFYFTRPERRTLFARRMFYGEYTNYQNRNATLQHFGSFAMAVALQNPRGLSFYSFDVVTAIVRLVSALNFGVPMYHTCLSCHFEKILGEGEGSGDAPSVFS